MSTVFNIISVFWSQILQRIRLMNYKNRTIVELKSYSAFRKDLFTSHILLWVCSFMLKIIEIHISSHQSPLKSPRRIGNRNLAFKKNKKEIIRYHSDRSIRIFQSVLECDATSFAHLDWGIFCDPSEDLSVTISGERPSGLYRNV